MKKAFLLILVSMILLLAFTSCDVIDGMLGGEPAEEEHEHEWVEATCKTAKTCATCGEKDGGTLPHTMVEATCETPKTCTVCNQSWGEPLGHNMSLQTCLVASTCRRCGLSDGEAPGHNWAEATCTKPQTCRVCAATVGDEAGLGHDYVTVVVVPTCTEGGQTTHTCSRCNDSYVEDVKPATGHLNDIVLEAVEPTCTETGLTAGVKCSACGTATTTQKVRAALGHNSTSSIVDPTCTSAGYTAYHCTVCLEDYTGNLVPALGHDYGADVSCSDAAVCTVCGFDNGGEPIGHDWVEATCTDPKMCARAGCDEKEGEALGHQMTEGNCLAPSTCERCGHTEGEKKTHVLTYTLSKTYATYTCQLCQTSYITDYSFTALDGSGYDNMTTGLHDERGYITNSEKLNYPLIKDNGGNNYYELLKKQTTDKAGQIEIWLPRDNKASDNFTSANGSVGFYSIKINAFMDEGLTMRFVDGSAAGDRWSAQWCIIDHFFTLGAPKTGEDGKTVVSATGWDGLVIYEKDLTDSDSSFTGWFELSVGIVLDAETDTITIYYYVDGKYVGYAVRELTTTTDGINSVYISGNSKAGGSGVMFDDAYFGYTVAGSWMFDDHIHSWVAGEVTAPSCATAGYTTYTCSCGAKCRLDLVEGPGHKNDIALDALDPTCTETGLTAGVKCSVCGEITKEQRVIAALGHTSVKVPELDPTCTEPGHSKSKVCTVCGEYTAEVTIIPATGHKYEESGYKATCTEDGHLTYTCSVCSDSYDETPKAFGHNFGDAKCTDIGVCLTCSFASDGPIGHDFAPATCIDPEICKRDCGATNGAPLGHSMLAPTCTAPSTCGVCGHTEGDKILHTLEHKYEKSTVTYFCSGCDVSYTIDTGYYLDGTNGDSWTGSNAVPYYGSKTAKIVDGHYEVINGSGSTGNAARSQIQMWIPKDGNHQFDFKASNNSLGYLSFKVNAYLTEKEGISFKLVDGIAHNTSGISRWSSEDVLSSSSNASAITITQMENGHTKFLAMDNYVLADIEVGADNFTGWVDVKMAIQLNGEFNQATVYYYIDGKFVHSVSFEITTLTKSINSVYISGYTSAKGSGLMLDDVFFGFTPNGVYEFDTCKHTYVEASCTTNKYCSTCGYIESGALGHSGGEASCDTLAICAECGESYGDYQHNMSEATCYSASVCADCGKTVGSLKPHDLVLTAETNMLKYSCSMCGAYYYVDTYYYLDGTSTHGMTHGLKEGFNATIVEDGANKYYEMIKVNSDKSVKGEVWIPKGQTDGSLELFTGFTTANNALGFLSFKVDANMDVAAEPLKVKLVDTNARSLGDKFWTEGSLVDDILILNTAENIGGVKTVSVTGWDKITLAKVEVGEDGFTGWIDVKIAIVLKDDDTITLHYYINGEYVASATKEMTIKTKALSSVYFYGKCLAEGTGYRLDDIAFGYSVGKEMVPGKTPDTPDTPDTPEVPENLDKTFEYTEINKEQVESYHLKQILAAKMKQWDQCASFTADGGTPKYVLAKRADGSEVEALYFSRKSAWTGSENTQFAEFRFQINGGQPGAYVTKITFDYIINGKTGTGNTQIFTDIYGNKFTSDAYVQVKTNGKHDLAGDDGPEFQEPTFILDGAWHTMTVDLGSDGLEILLLYLNFYKFEGEMMISNLSFEYRV